MGAEIDATMKYAADAEGSLGGSGNILSPSQQPTPSQPAAEMCAICKDPGNLLSPGDKDYVKTECGHGPYHLSCFSGHLSSSGSCPECRKQIGPDPHNDPDVLCSVCGGPETYNDPLVNCSHDACDYWIHVGCNEITIPDSVLDDQSSTAPQCYCSVHGSRLRRGDFMLEPHRQSLEVQAGLNIQAAAQPAARAERRQSRAEKKTSPPRVPKVKKAIAKKPATVAPTRYESTRNHFFGAFLKQTEATLRSLLVPEGLQIEGDRVKLAWDLATFWALKYMYTFLKPASTATHEAGAAQ